MFCKNCGLKLSEGISTCPRCGLDNEMVSFDRLTRVPTMMSLPEAIATALAQDSIGLLKAPQRFLGNVMDSVDNESRDMRVLMANCDDEFLHGFYRAAQVGTLESLDDAARRASSLLSDHRFIVQDVARELSSEVSDGIAAFLGLKTLDVKVGAALYDVFICCKEAEDATGIRTFESGLSERVSAALVRGGYRVFYPRISLVGRHPSTHAAVVRAALGSSIVLFLIGRSRDHLQSEWVRGCMDSFVAQHGGMRDAVYVGIVGRHLADLPVDVPKGHVLAFESNEAVARAIQLVGSHARELRNAWKDPRTRPVHDSVTADTVIQRNGPLRYKVVQLSREDGKTLRAVVVQVTKIGKWAAVLRFTHAGRNGHERVKVNRLVLGQEALVIMGEDAHLASIDGFQIAEYGKADLNLRWVPIGVKNGWLSLDLRNMGGSTIEVSSLELVLNDAASTLINIRQNATLSPNSESRISVSLSEKLARAVQASTDADLYLSAPLYTKLPKA